VKVNEGTRKSEVLQNERVGVRGIEQASLDGEAEIEVMEEHCSLEGGEMGRGVG
jgi:hypothetical protein